MRPGKMSDPYDQVFMVQFICRDLMCNFILYIRYLCFRETTYLKQLFVKVIVIFWTSFMDELECLYKSQNWRKFWPESFCRLHIPIFCLTFRPCSIFLFFLPFWFKCLMTFNAIPFLGSVLLSYHWVWGVDMCVRLFLLLFFADYFFLFHFVQL